MLPTPSLPRTYTPLACLCWLCNCADARHGPCTCESRCMSGEDLRFWYLAERGTKRRSRGCSLDRDRGRDRDHSQYMRLHPPCF
jgi:hypothetical protein